MGLQQISCHQACDPRDQAGVDENQALSRSARMFELRTTRRGDSRHIDEQRAALEHDLLGHQALIRNWIRDEVDCVEPVAQGIWSIEIHKADARLGSPGRTDGTGCTCRASCRALRLCKPWILRLIEAAYGDLAAVDAVAAGGGSAFERLVRRRTTIAIVVANALGALLVFVFLAFVVPVP